MTVSPQGRKPLAEPQSTPAGSVTGSAVPPPTLLRLPDLDPAPRTSTNRRWSNPTEPATVSDNDPAPKASPAIIPPPLPRTPLPIWEHNPPEQQPASPIGTRPAVIPDADQSTRNTAAELVPAAEPNLANAAKPTIAARPIPSAAEPSPAATKSESKEFPPRKIPVRQGTVPAGRSWMERLSSQSIVLLVLGILAATALLAGRKQGPDRKQAPVPSPEVGSAQEALTGPDARIAAEPAPQSRKGQPGDMGQPGDTVSAPAEKNTEASENQASETPNAGKHASGEAEPTGPEPTGPDATPDPGAFALHPPKPANRMEVARAATEPEPADPHHTPSNAEPGSDAEPAGLSLNGPEPAIDAVESQEADPEADVESTASRESYPKSATPNPIRDWSRYLPNPDTDYVADRPNSNDEPAGMNDATDGSATIPAANAPPFQR